MPLLLSLSPLLAASSKSTSSSGSDTFLLVIVVLFVAVYFLFLRPRQQAAKKQRENLSQAGLGDEIVTVGGIVGTIVDVDGDRLTLRSGGSIESEFGSDATYLTILRQAVQRKVEPQTGDVVGASGVDGHVGDDLDDEHIGLEHDDVDDVDDEDEEWDDEDEDEDADHDASANGHAGAAGTNGKGPQAIDGGGSATSTEEGRGG